MSAPLAPVMQGFFTERLIGQRQASPHTVASYRDTFRLLLGFVQHRTGITPAKLTIEDLNAVVIGAFLDHLEAERHNSARTRNNRLAAIHSLFAYAALRHPEHAALIQRVISIPAKRTDRQLVAFLTDDEVDALLAAPTATPGWAAATTRSCSSPSTPACASPSSSHWHAVTSTSGPAPTSAAAAKAARNGSRP
jgi:site-specific recombinase XerD